MAQLLPLIKYRAVDSNGDPLAGGKLYSYQAGTSTPLGTFTDQTEGTANTNPIILDANGEASVWIGTSSYKFELRDSSDVSLDIIDNVSDLGAGSVITSKLADGSVTTVKIANSNVTTAKLINSAVTTAKINNSAVTTPKIADSNVTTAKIADSAVTTLKLSAYNAVLSSASGTFTTVSSSFSDVTNLSCSITTVGNRVKVSIVTDGAAGGGGVTTSAIFGSAANSYIRMTRGGTDEGTYYAGTNGSGSCFVWHDQPAAGTYTYKIQGAVDSVLGGTLTVRNMKLFVEELR